MLKPSRALASIKKNSKWNKIIVDWIEQQKPVIAARYATSIHDTEGNNNQRLTKNARSQNQLTPAQWIFEVKWPGGATAGLFRSRPKP